MFKRLSDDRALREEPQPAFVERVALSETPFNPSSKIIRIEKSLKEQIYLALSFSFVHLF